jgi:APOBEC-like N-terminal domain
MGHNTREIIEKFAAKAKTIDMSGFQGAIVRVAGQDKTALGEDQMNWFRANPDGQHSERLLLKSSNVLSRIESIEKTMGKVYLYTRFAPCPTCANELETYPQKYKRVKFSLAFNDYRPMSAMYSEEAVKVGLKKLVAFGWKVRSWTAGEFAEPPSKRTKSDEKPEWTPHLSDFMADQDLITAYERQALWKIMSQC